MRQSTVLQVSISAGYACAYESLTGRQLAGTPMISVVDDDVWAREGLQSLIAAVGYEVRTFESAEEFVVSGSIAETACLVTDLNMPGMSGVELQAYLRSAGHRTPIIIVTAYPTDEHRSRALKDGATSFLTKPLDESVLVGCLARAIASPLRPLR
jgi:FixJ family two-component response regulator